uniref:Uncharacterized protein n=1 Tax=Mus musculus TaxID=10090 RepID=Q3TER2_MOUSE|nr:unnamed protein product [Mus musculus]
MDLAPATCTGERWEERLGSGVGMCTLPLLSPGFLLQALATKLKNYRYIFYVYFYLYWLYVHICA